jgi:hypothetical protein
VNPSSGVDICVYLIHYAAPQWCASAVRSLQLSRDVRLEIVVVDNGGGEALRRLLPAGVRILSTGSNTGFAGGANRGIGDWSGRGRRAPFVVVGSHDLHVHPHTFRALLDAAGAHPQIGILAPLVEGRQHRLPDLPTPPDGAGHVVRVEWASGTCLLLRPECIEAIGGFDEAFGSYVEDVDLCLRARDAGWLTGVVPGSPASGLGTAHPAAADVLMAVNGVRLARLRGGDRAGWHATWGLVARAARHAGGSVAAGRSRESRRRSWYLCAVQLKAFVRVIKAYRLTRVVPGGQVRSRG